MSETVPLRGAGEWVRFIGSEAEKQGLVGKVGRVEFVSPDQYEAHVALDPKGNMIRWPCAGLSLATGDRLREAQRSWLEAGAVSTMEETVATLIKRAALVLSGQYHPEYRKAWGDMIQIIERME